MSVKVRQIPKDSGSWYVVVTHKGERRAQKMSNEKAAGLLRTISAIFNAAAEDGIYRGANPALRPRRILRVDKERRSRN